MFPQKSAVRLLRTVLESLSPNPLANLEGIFGKFATWFGPYSPYSEYRMISMGPEFLKYLRQILILPIPFKRPFYMFLIPKTWFIESPEIVPPSHPHLTDDFPDEAWFFINGIMTDTMVADINREYLSILFKRAINLIHNPTDTILFDLIECALGKGWQRNTEPANLAVKDLEDALKKKQKVVVIAHSQGTIIIANALKSLKKRAQDDPEIDLGKLELYLFANCADQMEYTSEETPLIENFANQNDMVAKLGILAKGIDRSDIHLDGDLYVRDAWGHLLNAHYLTGIEERAYISTASAAKTPRLYQYLNGKSPALKEGL